MSILIEITSFEQNANAIRRIRQTVFVAEQGIDPTLEWDSLDALANFVMATHNTAGPVGTTRFFNNGKIGRMAVLKEWRHQGIGRGMLAKTVEQTRAAGNNKLHLSAQQSAIPFYEKNGFCCQGDTYYEAGILHQNMTIAINSDLPTGNLI